MSQTTADPTGPPDRFVRPNLAWYLAIQPGLGMLTAVAVSEDAYEQARGRVPLPSRRVCQALVVGTALVHAAEARFAFRKARSLGMRGSAPRWALETLVGGFPVLLSLNKVAAGQE